MKDLFTEYIRCEEWNSSAQQDSSEGLALMLECLNEVSSRPFGFCELTCKLRITCTSCSAVTYSQLFRQNVVIVTLTQEAGIVDMEEALNNSLCSSNSDRRCDTCENIGARENVEFVETKKFLILQFAHTLNARCIPLQNLELSVNNVTKKYQLECIIERSGSNSYNGHYWSYLKKKWHMV